MKKVIFVLTLAAVLVSSGAAFAQESRFGGALKVGLDFASDWEADTPVGTFERNTDAGASFCAEGYYRIIDYVDVGAGIQYLANREIDSSPGVEIWFVPVYGVLRVHPAMTDYTPYAIGQIGYSFHGGNSAYTYSATGTSGGLYWGVGAGFIFKRHFLVEILYSESRGTIESVLDVDITHRRTTISVGYNF